MGKKAISKEEVQREIAKNLAIHRRIFRTYGLLPFEYGAMLAKGCEICGTIKGRLCIDHIHIAGYKHMEPSEKKNYVRGILCFLCNTGIKGFDKTKDGKKNRQRLEGTVKYFKKYPLKGEL